MNSKDYINNLFWLSSNDNRSINYFYKRVLEYTQHEQIVLLLTDSENLKELLPIFKQGKLKEAELKRFVTINVDTIDECIDKLFEQHDWAWLPALIIVDLRMILAKFVLKSIPDLNSTESDVKPISFFQQLALCIADLFGYHRSVLTRVKKKVETKGNSSFNINDNIFSILILNENSNHLTKEQIDLLINLYYYKNNAFDEVNELLEKISL